MLVAQRYVASTYVLDMTSRHLRTCPKKQVTLCPNNARNSSHKEGFQDPGMGSDAWCHPLARLPVGRGGGAAERVPGLASCHPRGRVPNPQSVPVRPVGVAEHGRASDRGGRECLGTVPFGGALCCERASASASSAGGCRCGRGGGHEAWVEPCLSVPPCWRPQTRPPPICPVRIVEVRLCFFPLSLRLTWLDLVFACTLEI